MKQTWLMAIAALLMLAACPTDTKAADNKIDGNEKKVDNKSGYALAYGLYGNVKEVRMSLCKLTDVDPAEDPWVESDKLEYAFDRFGRITTDVQGNLFKYDDNGNISMLLYGNTAVKEIILDNKGRIESFLKQDGLNDRDMESRAFTYDALGRPLTEVSGYWEAGHQDSLVYEGDKIYPVKCITSGAAEAESYEYVTEYRYTKFDEQGNWTERYITTNGYEMIANDESTRTETHSENLERRVITYYSDKEISIDKKSKKTKK